MSGTAWSVFIPFLLGAISSFALLVYFWQEWQRRKRLIDPMHGLTIQADIKATRIERQKNSKARLSTHVVDCDFKDWKGTLHSASYTVSESDWRALQEQSTVSVTYLREMPNINSLTSQVHDKINSYRFLVFALALSPLLLMSMGTFYAVSEN